MNSLAITILEDKIKEKLDHLIVYKQRCPDDFEYPEDIKMDINKLRRSVIVLKEFDGKGKQWICRLY